jgi:hypothetical protein
VTVELETDGIGAELAGNGMANELFEIPVVVLQKAEGVHVSVLSVEEIDAG